MAVRVTNTALAVYLVVDGGEVLLTTDHPREPDVIVSGSLLALSRLAGREGDAVIRNGDVELSGNADIAQQFQQLLRYGRPDIEEELSRVVGDVAAHGIGSFLRGISDWGQGARETMRQNIGEYLQEESVAVPTRDEANAFSSQVGMLRDDVARFEARLKAVESKSGTREKR